MVFVHLMITVQKHKILYSKNHHTIEDFKMAITEYIRNVDLLY
jgi:imidazoleglycerol phosphate dehydratase HisB